ncbi:glycoside hydrolase family 2 TIM barrel-domain containing protein [Aromatoleum petrolei]|nr:glycoside hydrolase family 2 TIM barrel-domain containing protein [Aromatoleum petrolei]QTQ37111.1 Glycoside hydrolase superfamily protein [Aromatoleum petrolei]
MVAWTQGASAVGEPWQGAAFEGDRAALEKLAAAGARVVRVYRESDAWVLDAAEALGLKVVMGLWVGHPRHGFDLRDPGAVQAQEQAIGSFVTRHRGHPALLAWGVGNEVETGETDPLPSWREVDRLAGVVRALDPAHPTLMVVADTGMAQLRTLAGCCPNVDLLGINVYAGAVFDLPQRLRDAGIAKPVVVSELGPLGQWQAGRKPWGAPVEPTSSEKAAFFRDALAFLRNQPQIAGVFPFLWGTKQEQTATWHGLLLADGSLTAMTDALAQAWGKPVAEPAPAIRGIGIAADVFAPGAEISAGVDVASFDGSPLRVTWNVFAEATDLRKGGDTEAAPPRIEVRILHADATSVRFLAPQQPGAYRLFITIRDRRGKAATANLPFLVR